MARPELTFMRKLNEEQIKYAEKVAKAAIAAGVDPRLAVAIAFREGSLDPTTIDSTEGAIGMMQVKPATGKAYGYSEKDLRIIDKNIDAGIKNIKEALAYTKNDPLLSAVYYHSGPDGVVDLANNKLGPNTKEYLKALNGFGAFIKADEAAEAPQSTTEQYVEQNAESSAPTQPAKTSLVGVTMNTPEQDFVMPDSAADLKRQEYGLYGAGAGTGAVILPKIGEIASGALGRTVRAFDAARNPPTAPTGGLPTGGAPTPPPAPPSAPMSAPAGGLPQGQPPTAGGQAPGYMTRNYGTAAGLTEIEAGRALDNTKQAGGVHDLLSQRREAINKLQSMGGNNFVENPRFGGIMTQAPSVGGGPRESFAMQTPEAGKPAQLAPIPKAPIIPTTPPPLSGLDQVKNMFTGMMRQSLRFMPIVGPPLAGLSIGRDVADIETQLDHDRKNRDYTDIGLTAAGALAAGASLYPPAFPVAAPLAISIPTFRNIRRGVLAQESDPELQRRNMMPPTAEEIEMANRPFVRYPSIR